MSGSPRIDFVISNPGHHLAQILPLFARLRAAGVSSRVISLCDLRGFATPRAEIEAAGADCLRIIPRWVRPSPSRGLGTAGGFLRRWQRDLAWALLLSRPLAAAWRATPELAVLPNDVAYPYDRLVKLLAEQATPFVLLQEGIRFPLPAAGDGTSYGSGGAAAIAAWGESSADYFRAQRVPSERIWLTGNPRFDALPTQGLTLATPAAPTRRLLFLSNPIDDQGFCSTAEKLALFRRFVAGLEPLLASGQIELRLRLHGRESAGAYAAAIADLTMGRTVHIGSDRPLVDEFAEADAVVVTASTAGLEALLFGLPLGVLELPGHGFVYDYVDRGVALGLSWGQPLADQVTRLLGDREAGSEETESYLARSLATRRNATERVTRLLLHCLGRSDASDR